MSTVIKVENVSKQYRLGEIGTGTISHDLNRWWHKVRGKEDPFLQIGEANDRSQKGSSDYVWALQNINFEVQQGEVLGIIGRNGAGKSTLLKILSKTTAPTTGSIKIKGRIASLLEVGTGFHPELSGRDNIFLNGAILGMSRHEIKSKFDEIVDFSGVERYIDTPVKRYSSGMYVRLAFAVAAHLESEILILDEVLAVGDAEFQKKCLGKMGDVSKNEGRTVIFVSHNMDAVYNLCNTGIFFENGFLKNAGNIQTIIDLYLKNTQNHMAFVDLDSIKSSRSGKQVNGRLQSIKIFNQNQENTTLISMGTDLILELELLILRISPKPEIGVSISNLKGVRLHHFVSSWHVEWMSWNEGKYKVRVRVPSLSLYPGKYNLSVWFRPHTSSGSDDFVDDICTIEILQNKSFANHLFKDFAANGGVYKMTEWDFKN